jgi:hypothetical protein
MVDICYVGPSVYISAATIYYFHSSLGTYTLDLIRLLVRLLEHVLRC